MIVNGIDYPARAAALRELGIDPWGSDDTQFGTPQVHCNQHQRVHTTGWCGVSNIEKWAVKADDEGVQR